MVEGGGGIHDEHAAGEAGGPEGVLPVASVAEPQDKPGGAEGENHAGEVGEGIEALLGCAPFDGVHGAKVANSGISARSTRIVFPPHALLSSSSCRVLPLLPCISPIFLLIFPKCKVH